MVTKMTMIEKIARAINIAGTKVTGNDPIEWENISDKQKLQVMFIAKAALESMKEPTEGMIEAGKTYQLNNEDEIISVNSNNLFKAMIEAALKE